MFVIIYTYILIFISSGSFFLGLHIFIKNPKSFLHRIFFIKTFLVSLYICSTAFIQVARNIDELIFFQKTALILVAIFFPFFLHFFIIMTQTKVFKFLKIIIYLISLFIIIIILLSKDTISNIKNINGLWHYKDMFFDTLWGNPYYFINLIYALISLSLLYLRIKTTHLIKEKKQYIIMIGSFMIPLLLGSTTDAIIPFFFTDFSLHLMPFLMAFYILGLYYAFLKYKLLDFNINDLFEEVLSNINDMVIILNEDGKILKVNERCLKTFLLSRENLINKTIYEIIEIKSSLKENLKNLFKGKISIFNAVVSFHKKNETITADSYFSRIIDKFGDFMGVLVILKENMDIKRFIIQFKLTYRQFEIIMLAVKGLTNNEICEKLNIKRRTLENHLFTIYYKLSIKNKVELVRLASDFNII